MAIRVKRAYETSGPSDGTRYLVDRIWPRGVSKKAAAIDEWLKELGPSHELRKWFGHDPNRWSEFKKRYFRELDDQQTLWTRLVTESRTHTVTLVYSARDEDHNQAVALREYLSSKTGK